MTNPTTPSAAPTMEQIVGVYGKIKDARTAKRHAWEAEDAELEKQQDRLKAYMLDILNKTGAKSIATSVGTAYRREKIRPSASDWTMFYDWIQQDPERFEALEKRIKVGFIADYMENNDNELPPGVNIHREFEVAVRRT